MLRNFIQLKGPLKLRRSFAIKKIFKEEKEHKLLNFDSLGLSSKMLDIVKKQKWELPFLVQAKVIPAILEDNSVVFSSKTGEGKTAAYFIPILQNLLKNELDDSPKKDKFSVNCLVLSPSKELSLQLCSVIRQFCKTAKVHASVDIGNHVSKSSLFEKYPRFLIITPQQLHHWLTFEKPPGSLEENDISPNSPLDLSQLKYFVLDECDRLLMSPHVTLMDEIWNIIFKKQKTGMNQYFKGIRFALCTATITEEVKEFVHKHIKKNIIFDTNQKFGIAKNIRQFAFRILSDKKCELLKYLLKESQDVTVSLKDKKILIFCASKKRCSFISQALTKLAAAATLHSGMSVSKRNKTMDDFNNGNTKILIATDVVTRGIHIPNVDYVINYDLPDIPQEYIHRVGRTGRAGLEGKSIALISKNTQKIKPKSSKKEKSEEELFKEIEKLMEKSKNNQRFSQIEHMDLPDTFVENPDIEKLKNSLKNTKYQKFYSEKT